MVLLSGRAGDVVYSTPKDEEMYDEFREYIEVIQKYWEQALRRLDPEGLENTHGKFVLHITLQQVKQGEPHRYCWTCAGSQRASECFC